MNLSGNTIVITGGTSGIGLGLAERFLLAGNKVIVCGRRQDRLEKIRARHPTIVTRICDVADERQRADFASWVLKSHPETNVLVNNAGIQLLADIGSALDMKRVRAEIETNLVSVIHLSGLFAPRLGEGKNAAIVNVSSGLGFAPIAIMPVYCATKAAVHSFTLSLRYQLKSKGVKVFEIIPPAVDTELGGDRRSDPSQTHGGMAVPDFLDEVIKGLEGDSFEIAVGQAVGLRAKGEALFESMNNR